MQENSIKIFHQWIIQALQLTKRDSEPVKNSASGEIEAAANSDLECREGLAQAGIVAESTRLVALPGDAGHRRYFRVEALEYSWIAVLYPPESTAEIDQFVRLARYFRLRGVHTPGVVAADGQQGFLLLEDLGTDHLQDELMPETADGLYANAMMSLLCLQQLPRNEIDELNLPEYSRERFRMEMNLMCEWFVEKLLQYEIDANTAEMLDEGFRMLEDSALQQPQVLVHRDYHSRNLLIRHAETIGVIDFQDAVLGPICYDPASLLRDCYIAWPEYKVTQWSLSYKRIAEEAGVMPKIDDGEYLRWFDLMGLQRHIKVLGIFSRLSLRDGKHQYLQDLPLVVHYIVCVAKKYESLRTFVTWFEQQLLPIIALQPWYCPVDVEHAGIYRQGADSAQELNPNEQHV
ncbi:hypothetical protein TDB9533_00158 [Thalassocella blandensis]|nr:hypothetical protein TDB9533_00158 [Thalassocella blandensis]